MKRRAFLKKSTAGLTAPFWLQYCDFKHSDFPVYFNSDHTTGHLILQSEDWPTIKGNDLEVAIVGGGIAGLTAAYQLRNSNFKLFELSNVLGGTVSTESYRGIQFSQGAHYDLAYPDHYGPEVISLMQKLDLIEYEPWRKSWSFKDRQHIIPHYRRQQCFDFGKRRRDVISENELKDQFVELMLQFEGEMKLPSRLIGSGYHHLNELSFKDFLKSNLSITSSFIRQVDYHMYDDYGGSSEMVSALAGIHYFACRPYYKEDVPLFSPPSGNKYFLDSLLQHLDPQKLRTSSLIKSITKNGDAFELQILDVQKRRLETVRADHVIYAGQKHALKYIYPDQARLFNNSYAPWMVVNLISDQKEGQYGFWQNEFLGKNDRFLGFIDSSVQSQSYLRGKRVFTGYYCLKPEDRSYLLEVEKSKEGIAKETQGYVEEMLGAKIRVDACFIKVMGHAMPIPAPGYLFNDANKSPDAQIIYAGVDNGRLPLLFEAMDSGLQAASLI